MSRTYSAATRRQAKQMFLDGMETVDIARSLDIPPSTVNGWRDRGTWDTPGATRQWPPFGKGSQAALKHGANSEMKITERIEEIQEDLLDSAPWLRNPAFRHTVDAWLYVEAQCSLLRDFLDNHGMDSKKGAGFVDFMDRCENRASRLRRELGLTPAGYLKIVRDIAEAVKAADGNLDALDEKGKAIFRTQAAELRALREQLHEAREETTRQIARNAMAVGGES